MTYLHVWHDLSHTLIYMCAMTCHTHRKFSVRSVISTSDCLFDTCIMTHLHDSFVYVSNFSFMYVTWEKGVIVFCWRLWTPFRHVWRDSFMCVTWLIQHKKRVGSLINVSDSIRASWLIYMCDMASHTHTQFSVRSVIWTSDMTHSYPWHEFKKTYGLALCGTTFCLDKNMSGTTLCLDKHRSLLQKSPTKETHIHYV